MAQEQPPPGVQWSAIDHEDERSESGTYYEFTPGSDPEEPSQGTWSAMDEVAAGHGDPQTAEESGEEWNFGHCNLRENDVVVGFATSGYTSWPNCYWTGVGCEAEYPIGGAAPDLFETPGYRRGETRGVVARYDLKGKRLWYKVLLPGLLYNVVQDENGDLIVAGSATSNQWPEDVFEDEEGDPLPYVPIRYNDDPQADISAVPCSTMTGYFGRKGYVAKLSADGELLWCTMFNLELGLVSAWERGSILQDIEVVPYNSELAYYAVGNSSSSSFVGERAFAVRIDEDGMMIDNFAYDLITHPELQNIYPHEWGWSSSVARDPGSGRLFVAGFTSQVSVVQAVGLFIDPATDPYMPYSIHFTGDPAGDLCTLGGHISTMRNFTSGGGFVTTNGVTRVVWPIIGNFLIGDWYAGQTVGDLRVHCFELDGSHRWTRSLDEVRAYDMQSDITATTDGMVAVISTKWAKGYEFGGTEFGFGNLPQDAQDCLMNEHHFDDDPGSNDHYVPWDQSPRELFDYWNTDAFVAKLDPSSLDGTVLWRTQWDADPGTTFECFPGDLKNQECMYKITEAPDGGLVVSGNTSHNFDDYYLAKLYPDCQSTVEYDPVIAAAVMSSPARSYTVGTNETWNTDKNIHGTIIIPDGHQLNIAGSATIRFADSRLLAHPTRIIVQAGGRLSVGTNVTLTSLPGCNDQKALWDGIIVQGDMDYPLQEPLNASAQGSVSLRPCLIENARVAVSVGEDLLATNSMAVAQELASGGIVTADGTTFRNNVRDVVFSPFENHHGDYPNGLYGGEENKSRFRTCTFENTAQLNDPYQRPQAHATLFGVRGVRFQGCSFKGGVYPMLDENGNTVLTDQYMGQGIKSLNSTFAVEARCQPQQYGDPCTEEELVRNTFTTLWNGVHASTFGDMSRTFIVDRSDFVGCVRGIRMEGIQDAGITLNTFEVGDLPVGDLAVTPYGVYSDQCTGYEIEENAFGIGSHSSALKKVGLVIKDSGKNYNTFYNNTFDALHVGSLIEGGNASEDEITGLEIKCNDYGLTTKCDFDVALTGEAVKIQKTQGQALDIQDPNTYGNPAGNRFSLTHDPNPPELDDLEADWFVEDNASTTADYFHHTPIIGSRTLPTYRDALNLLPSDQGFSWPGKEDACPSHLIRRTRSENRMASSSADEDLSDSKDAYDAAKDDGETYSLLTYVSDPGHSSTQVRDALQSTAPKVSAEVWNAAFGRDPAMSAWHITQALLSNSPLQGEVLKRVIESGLPTFYLGLIASAQTGEANILSLLESGVAYHAGLKADALVDLGRSAFTDSLDLAGGLDSLKWWHEQLPADNHGAAVGAVLSVLGDMLGLYDLAEAYELAGEDPGLYGLVKRYASGWPTADAPTMAWVAALGEQRSVQGSAQANAWLEATGVAAVDEIILLPREERASSASAQHHSAPINWSDDALLEAFPNPSSGPTYLVYRTSGASGPCVLRVIDAKGELVRQFQEANGSGIIELSTEGWASGLYVVELRYDAAEALRIKLSVQR